MKKKTTLVVLTAVLLAQVISAARSDAAWLGRVGTYRFVGAGFGHGIGMSQYGAKGMAEAGYSAAQILNHYYQGTGLSTIPQPSLRVHLTDVGFAPGGISFYTSSTVMVTIDGTGEFYHVNAPTTGPPAVFSANGSGLYLSQGPNLIRGPISGTFALRFDPTLDPGLNSLIHIFPPNIRYKHGRLEVTRQAATSEVRAVLRDLPMEKYLYGLGEVPSSWPAESLKAQAVAGRTYAADKIRRLGQNRSDCSCGLYSTVRDQNYVGYEKELGAGASNWKAAVDATNAIVATYGGVPIEAYYSSSSGGHTENSEYVFSATLPYLKGVPDPWDDAVSPHGSWTRAFLGSDLERWLNRYDDTAVGTLFGIELRSPYGVSGRVTRTKYGGGVRILGMSGTPKQVDGDRFRQVVNAGLAQDERSSEQLKSTLFQLGFEPFPHGFRGGTFVAGGVSAGQQIIASGADAGGGPNVVVSDKSGKRISSFFPYDVGFSGGVRVALCDLEADGIPEVVTAPGPNGSAHIRIFNQDGTQVRSFFAYDLGFTGGIYVACGDTDGTAGDEIVTGAGPGGGPHVRVFSKTGEVLHGFFAYDLGFKGGVRVGVGELASGQKEEVVTAAGPGGGPHVRIFDVDGNLMSGFFPYDLGFKGGLYVGTLPLGGTDGVITGPGEGGGAHLRVLTPTGAHVWDSTAFGGPMANGVRVASAGGEVLASTGPGTWPLVRLVP